VFDSHGCWRAYRIMGSASRSTSSRIRSASA
jgi:hypothetical protein